MESCVVESLELKEDSKEIVINQITISNPMFYNFLVVMNDEERKKFVERIISIGFDVIQTQDKTNRVDYVRNEFDRMTEEFVRQFTEVFSEDGKIASLMENYFGEKGDVTCLLTDTFGEDGSVVSKILNPSDEETPLGKFRRDLEHLLDITKEGTAFYKLKQCVEEGLAEVSKQIEIKDKVTKAVSEEREKGTVKGRDFQEFLTEQLDAMATPLEDTVTFVGDDTGLVDKVGDVLIEINPSNTRGITKSIIVEAKKTKVTMSGKNSFLKELDQAMKNRAAHYVIGAVYETFIPPQWGVFRRFAGNKIVISIPEESDPIALDIAYKVARAELIAQTLSEEIAIDASKIIEITERALSKLENMRAIRTTITNAVTNLNDVHIKLGIMATEIKEDLDELTSVLQKEEEEAE